MLGGRVIVKEDRVRGNGTYIFIDVQCTLVCFMSCLTCVEV